jgi:hypothetical protein
MTKVTGIFVNANEPTNYSTLYYRVGARDGAVSLGNVLQGRGFDSQWYHWNFLMT